VQYHRMQHAPLFLSIPAVQQYVRRYVQEYTASLELPGMPPFAYDATTKLWFDSPEDSGRVFSDAEYPRLVRPDEVKFLDLHDWGFLLLTETVAK
jgi:hypothetical protein